MRFLRFVGKILRGMGRLLVYPFRLYVVSIWQAFIDLRYQVEQPGQRPRTDLILLLLLILILTAWFLFSLEPLQIGLNELASRLGAHLFNLAWPTTEPYDVLSWPVWFYPLLPFGLLVIALLLMRLRLRKEPRRTAKSADVPASSQGLTLMLSNFSVFRDRATGNTSVPGTPEDIGALRTAMATMRTSWWTQTWRNRLYTTNWGPLCVAVEHHRSQLRHVWLITSQESYKEADAARMLIRHIAGEEVEVHYDARREQLTVQDANDVGETFDVAQRVFDEWIPAPGLQRPMSSQMSPAARRP